ncbi:hypothetical protein ACFV29_30880 [Streptomyces sp. NPDC059690]|uniref:hypothetical protein n=1 Tax=Streptomyces sp. NPDC059690 TaxID=3346907 RepID=UPI0036A81D95
MNRLRRRLGRILDDIRQGRHLEAYIVFAVGLVLFVLGLLNRVDGQVLLPFTVAALSLLVFRTAAPPDPAPASPEEVLRTRQDLGPLRALLERADDLRVYGPTAINVLASAEDLRRLVLQRGGTARFVVLEPSPAALAQAAVQLDDNLDLAPALQSSLGALRRLDRYEGFGWRMLPFNPGFSVLIVNGDRADGTVVVEFHGFGDDTINTRMHLVLERRSSPHWYEYWLRRFEAVWAAALPGPSGAPEPSADGAPPARREPPVNGVDPQSLAR